MRFSVSEEIPGTFLSTPLLEEEFPPLGLTRAGSRTMVLPQLFWLVEPKVKWETSKEQACLGQPQGVPTPACNLSLKITR